MRMERLDMKILKFTTILLVVIALSLLSFFQVLAQDENCDNDWYINFNQELLPGYWTPGEHSYTFELTDQDLGTEEYTIYFEVSESAPIYDGQVMLRFTGPKTFPRFTHVDEINPLQDTVFQVSWVSFDSTRNEAIEFFSEYGVAARIRWDGVDYITMKSGPLMNGCDFQDDSVLFFRHWEKPYIEK